MGKYINQIDLENALSSATIIQLFDDDDDGVADADAVASVIDRAEAEVESWMIGDYSFPLNVPTDRLLKHSALDYAVAFSFERHPEYVRTFGENPRGHERYKRAMERMQRIQSAQQKLPDETVTQTPRNVGGIATDPGPRIMVTGMDGMSNGGDF